MRKTEEELGLYKNYLGRNSSKKVSRTVNKTEDTRDLADKMNSIQTRLLESFPNLSIIADTIEGAAIVVDARNNESPASYARRLDIYNKLLTSFQKDEALFKRIRTIYPSFGLNMQDKVSPEDYEIYMSEVSKMKKLCGRVNTHPVSETLDNFPKNGDDPDSPYLRLLYDIAECIDSYEFQKASIIEKRFIKSEINEFSRLAMEREWDTADNTIRPEVEALDKSNRDKLTRIEKYARFYDAPNKIRIVQFESKDKEKEERER